MVNYHLLPNLIKEIPTSLRRYIARKLRRVHAIPRAHKVIDKTIAGKAERAPLPDRIQQQIDDVLKNQPDLLNAVVSEKNDSLLERLKKVFVTSTGENKDMFNKTRLTPLQYNLFQPDVIEEYKENIPEGKFSLKQAEIFLREFQNNPGIDTMESLSEKLKIEPNRLMCILTHTKMFKAVLPINKKTENPSYLQQVVESMVPALLETEPDEEKAYRILDRRTLRFKQYYEEKLGLENSQKYVYSVKNPGKREVRIDYDVVKDDQLSIAGAQFENAVTKKDETDTSDGKITILVDDLKRGEDPEALEELPELPASESTIFRSPLSLGEKAQDTGETGPGIGYPHHEKFDVFKVMEKQDREARRAKRQLEKLKEEEEERDPESEQKDESRKIVVQEKISSKRT